MQNNSPGKLSTNCLRQIKVSAIFPAGQTSNFRRFSESPGCGWARRPARTRDRPGVGRSNGPPRRRPATGRKPRATGWPAVRAAAGRPVRGRPRHFVFEDDEDDAGSPPPTGFRSVFAVRYRSPLHHGCSGRGRDRSPASGTESGLARAAARRRRLGQAAGGLRHRHRCRGQSGASRPALPWSSS